MHLFVILLIFFCMVEVAFGQTSKAPSKRPSIKPSKKPTVAPTSQPTGHPTSHPTSRPTSRPTSKQTQLKPVISSNSISPSSSGNIKTPSVALTSTNIPTKAPSISYYPTGPSLAPTPIEQHPGWFTAHYSAGHVAGAIIGSLTAAIACLLCAYNGRNKRGSLYIIYHFACNLFIFFVKTNFVL